MQAVGQFDDNDANIFRHRHGHFLKVFCLRFRLGSEFNLRQLADAVHQVRHRIAKLLGQGGFADAGVFNDIVQQRGNEAVMI